MSIPSPEQWPPALFAGVLFFVLWIPIVMLASAGAYLRDRRRLIPEGSATDWKKAVGFMLALGFPAAIGFGVVFYLEGVVGNGIAVGGAVVVISVVLIGVVLPRLNRWE